MIAVITGSTGFIGFHLVTELLRRGAAVRALYRPETPRNARVPGVAGFEVDLLDPQAVLDSPVWRGATHVFHLAGATRGASLDAFRRGNVLPATNLFSALAQRDSRPRVVLVSSQAAAGPARLADAPVRDADRPLPAEDYGRSKLEAEQVAMRYARTLPITIIRPAAVFGPRDGDFLHVFRQATRRIAIHVVPPHHQFSHVYVSDLVSALILAAERPAAVGRNYFVADATPTSWRQLYDLIARVAGTPSWQVSVPLVALGPAAVIADMLATITNRMPLLNRSKIALARQRWWLCDASGARTDLGWDAQVPLLEGVRNTYLSYLDAGLLKHRASVREPELNTPETIEPG